MKRVYFASKLKHAPMWRKLCAENNHIIAHARWLKHSTLGTPDTPDNARRFWIEDEEDILTADIVVVYAEPSEHLRGALVEAGLAIANRKTLIVVGQHPDYGTWQYHPGVIRIETLDETLKFIRNIL